MQQRGTAVAVLFLCEHDVIYAGLCAQCGKDVTSLKTDSIAHAHRHLAGVSVRLEIILDSKSKGS